MSISASMRGLIDLNATLVLKRLVADEYALVKDNIPTLCWEIAGNRRILKTSQGTVVLSIESVCDMEVAKNARGEIIWPEENVDHICGRVGSDLKASRNSGATFTSYHPRSVIRAVYKLFIA